MRAINSLALFRLTAIFIALSPSVVFSSFTPKDMLSAPRVSPAIPNPNGTLAVFSQRSYSFDTDSWSGGLYLLPIELEPNAISTAIVNDSAASDPAWLDDRTILYILTKKGESSLRTYDTNSGKDVEIESFNGAIGDLKTLSLDKETVRFAFSAKVTPHGDIVRANETEPSNALVYNKIWVRHWDEWITQNKNSLFSGTLVMKRGGYSIDEVPRNMLNATEEIHDLESPVPPWGGGEDYSLSKTHLAFVAKDPHLNPAVNNAAHVYILAFNDSTYLHQVTKGLGAASAPVWSADGKYLAYLEMLERGYEADRRRVVIFKPETHEYNCVTEDWDRSPSSILWSKDSKTLYLTTEEHGKLKLFELPLHGKSEPKALVKEHSISAAYWAGKDILISQSSLVEPSLIQLYDTKKDSLQHLYSTWSSPLSKKSVEEFWYRGHEGHQVHGFLTLPESFDRKKKYSLAFLIHGGPQSAWEDSWSTRWNPAVFANAGEGWVVAAINPTGSTGYGQKFTDAIKGNWGTTPYFDLAIGYDFLLEEYDFIDGNRTVALGASYGGYMINWIQGHDLGRKFNALVWYTPKATLDNDSHDGVFSTVNTFYTTEELYFAEHDFLGVPWDPESVYQEHNPANFVQYWKTPQLVIHGSLDYRLPEAEGLAAFNALQRLGIPSKLLVFRDENHWVLKPKNSLKWHEEVIGWITKWTSHPHAVEKDMGFVIQSGR